jgi:hypothetical protein
VQCVGLRLLPCTRGCLLGIQRRAAPSHAIDDESTQRCPISCIAILHLQHLCSVGIRLTPRVSSPESKAVQPEPKQRAHYNAAATTQTMFRTLEISSPSKVEWRLVKSRQYCMCTILIRAEMLRRGGRCETDTGWSVSAARSHAKPSATGQWPWTRCRGTWQCSPRCRPCTLQGSLTVTCLTAVSSRHQCTAWSHRTTSVVSMAPITCTRYLP